MKIEVTPTLEYRLTTVAKEYMPILGRSRTKAYSLDKDFNIVEGEGWIASNESYNYHNNYDTSEDTLWFETEKSYKAQKWWTPSLQKVKELQQSELLKAIVDAETFLKEINSKIE